MSVFIKMLVLMGFFLHLLPLPLFKYLYFLKHGIEDKCTT